MLQRSSVALAMLLLATMAAHGETKPTAPDEVDGLLAWYSARSLYDKLLNGEPVTRWPDASKEGQHHLTEEGNGAPSIFHTVKLNEKPLIKVGKRSSFAVANPFTLNDHTIFLVYRRTSKTKANALFSGVRNKELGVVLTLGGKQHVMIDEGNQKSGYNPADTDGVGAAFSITVLSREDGRLRAFVDGVDVSGTARNDTPLEVGRLFDASLSRTAPRDAEGLSIAELIFYGRGLTDAERNGITAHLAEEFALELREAPPQPTQAPSFDWSGVEAQASLTTSSQANLNVEFTPLTWDEPVHLEGPFRLDPEQPTRLFVERDARVHLSVRLLLRTSDPETRLRVLVLRNEDDYQIEDEALTEPDGPEGDDTGGTRLVGHVAASLDMQKGDWVEIIVARDGGEGTVTAVPGKSVVLAVAK